MAHAASDLRDPEGGTVEEVLHQHAWHSVRDHAFHGEVVLRPQEPAMNRDRLGVRVLRQGMSGKSRLCSWWLFSFRDETAVWCHVFSSLRVVSFRCVLQLMTSVSSRLLLNGMA